MKQKPSDRIIARANEIYYDDGPFTKLGDVKKFVLANFQAIREFLDEKFTEDEMTKRIEIKPEGHSWVGKKIRKRDWTANVFWELYEDHLHSRTILKDGKKYKVMSPATYQRQLPNSIGHGYFLSERLFSEKPDSILIAEGSFLCEHRVIQWPALDGNGNPIQYFVEVKG